MPRIAYILKSFKGERLTILEHADQIMREYQAKGYSLTLRQLYYQFVARDIFANDQKNYARLGDVVNEGRMAGELDWEILEDRTRGIEEPNVWSSPRAIIAAVAAQFKTDLWKDHDFRPEIWVEKEALAGVVEGVAEKNRVGFLACRGYTSASELWRAGQRIVHRYENTRQQTLILHLGDHDPSGIDMTRDNRERLRTFCEYHLGIAPFEFRRIALNMEQVEQYNPPPNPAKNTDSRFRDYMLEFGDESWELDALDPETLEALIDEHVATVREDDVWEENTRRENQQKHQLEAVREHWDRVAEFATNIDNEEG